MKISISEYWWDKGLVVAYTKDTWFIVPTIEFSREWKTSVCVVWLNWKIGFRWGSH